MLRRVGQSPVPRIFISHSSKDNSFCYKLIRDLRRALGDESAVWFDTLQGLTGGDKWWQKIVEELTDRNVFIVIVSPDAMTSPWVNDEITLAWTQKNSNREKRIIPVLYAACEIRDDIATLRPVSFLPPRTYTAALKELLQLILAPFEPQRLPRRVIAGLIAAGLVGIGGLSFALPYFIQRSLNEHATTPHPPSTNAIVDAAVLKIPGTPMRDISIGPWSPWSPDSRYLAVLNGGIDVWDIQQKKRISSFYGHTDSAIATLDIAWSSDGKAIASLDSSGTMQITNPFTGKLVQTYQCFSKGIAYASIVWLHDMLRVVAITQNNSDLSIWSAGSQEYSVPGGENVHALDIAYWSSDGTHLALQDLESPVSRVWDASLENKVLVYHSSYQAAFVAWSPNLQYLASSIDTYPYTTVQVWNTFTAKLLLTYQGHSDVVGALTWSPDGKSIVSGSGDETAQIWDAHTGVRTLTYRGHVNERAGGIDAISWSSDGKYVASTSYKGPVHIWQLVGI